MEDRFHANGQPARVIRDGVMTDYYKDAGLRAQGPVADGKMQGEWRFWRKTGELWQVCGFMDDLQHGELIRYARDGSVELRQWFDMGRKRKAPPR